MILRLRAGGHGGVKLALVACLLVIAWGGAAAATVPTHYYNNYFTSGNETYEYETLSAEEKYAFAWTEPASPAAGRSTPSAAPQAPHPDYDDGYLLEKAHPDFMWDNCIQLDSGEVLLNGTRTCHVVVTGMDDHADLLTGGLDGLYVLIGCYMGKAMYLRKHSPPGEERILWYSPVFGDWQIMLGEYPQDSDLVVYSNYGQISPTEAEGWHLSADFNNIQSQYLAEGDQELFYKMQGVSVTCEDDAPGRLGPRGTVSMSGLHEDQCDPRDPMCVVAPGAPSRPGAGAPGEPPAASGGGGDAAGAGGAGGGHAHPQRTQNAGQRHERGQGRQG